MILIALYNYLLTNHQYLVDPLFDLIAAEILISIELMKFRHSSGVIAFHSRRRQCFSTSLLLIVWRLTLVFSKPHKCSMAFRPGDSAGHSRSSIEFSLNLS